jgi:tryptophanyl-tRNA synthetase
VAGRFNELYGQVFPEPAAMVSRVPRLVGLDGAAKMSKSLGNCIYLSDDPESVRAKVMSAVTDPARIHKDDPGHPEICTISSYHAAFDPDGHPDTVTRCRAGTIGCVACKKRLVALLEELLAPMRERRAAFSAPGMIDDILLEGTRRACAEAGETLDMVRRAMTIDYFGGRGR